MWPFRTAEEKKLLAALSACGAKGACVSAADAWNGFKAYGRGVTLAGGTGLLFQVGTYAFGGGPLFYFNPVCQFQRLGATGEHEGFEQLQCELTCPPSPSLTGVERNLWSFAYPSADAFFEAVEALPEFGRAIRHGQYHLRVRHDRV